ncbi:unnamed protein product, partial [Oppiella nova]
LYEILTLGQSPYSLAKDNEEVFNYVITGRTLDRPHNCPDELYVYGLMKRCWNFQSEDRPNFSECLQTLEKIKRNMSGSEPAITAVHNQNYIFSRGFDNPGYNEDERQAGHSSHSIKNSSNSSSAQSCSSSSTIKPNYQNGHIQYQDLTQDDYGLTDADGYQIPISKSPLQVSVD